MKGFIFLGLQLYTCTNIMSMSLFSQPVTKIPITKIPNSSKIHLDAEHLKGDTSDQSRQSCYLKHSCTGPNTYSKTKLTRYDSMLVSVYIYIQVLTRYGVGCSYWSLFISKFCVRRAPFGRKHFLLIIFSFKSLNLRKAAPYTTSVNDNQYIITYYPQYDFFFHKFKFNLIFI